MAQTPISPKQADPGAASLDELYDCPDATSFIGWIYAINRSETPTGIKISIQIDNAADDNMQYLAGGTASTMPIGSYEVLGPWKVTLTADDRVNIYNTLASVTFQLFGVEIT